MNLVFNARDAMPGGGRLCLTTAHVDVSAGDSEHGAGAAPGAYVSLKVSDTGHGMDDQTQANLFEPFFTTKASTKGTGLGLSLVQAVVRELGGMLTVHSRIGEGSTFGILLPRVAPPVTSPLRPGGACDLYRGVTKPCCWSTTRWGYGSSSAIC